MRGHLRDDEMAQALAGVDLGDETREHLAVCLACRAELAHLEALVAGGRHGAADGEPDWGAMAAGVMDRLDGAPQRRPSPRWRRAALAVAAALLIAIAVGVLRPDRTTVPPAAPSIEDILAEMDELLADDRIPGFEVIDPGPGGYEATNDNGAS
jgi:hypothetical protein